MKQWLRSAALFVALLGTSGCDSDANGGLFDGAQGGTDGRGGDAGGEQTGGTGDGGATGSDSLEDPETIRAFANLASAVAVYAAVYEPFAVADGQVTFPDPSCPAVTDDGTTLEIAGDCTDDTGNERVGSATVERSPSGARHLSLLGFGVSGNHRTGEANLVRIDATNHDFDVNLVHETVPVTMSYDYSGHVVGDYDSRTVWSGSGSITREGSQHPLGRIEATTTDEVVDGDVCSGQPVSGNTSLRDDAGNTVVITYDGSLDCDDDLAASYSLNGEPQGVITGIACSFSGARPHRPFVPFGLLLVAGILVSRRSLSCRCAGEASRVERFS